jgi:membrane protease YdiL (CAAX protease family)
MTRKARFTKAQPRVQSLQERYFPGFLIAITVYIALVNSYALFSVYPAVKQHQAGVPILVYFWLSSPMILYGLVRLNHFKKTKQNHAAMQLGFGIVLVAVLMRLLMSHDSFSLIVLSTLVYLVTGFVEETLWRGWLWKAVEAKTGSTKQTYLYVSLHFTVLHIPFALLRMANPLLFLGKVLALGLALGAARIGSKGVRLPIFVHAAINVLAKT